MAEPIIQLEGLWKQFGPVTVLRDITLDIMPGEVLGILGENGAGKSTLLKLISGVYQPSGGVIRVDGTAYNELDPVSSRALGIAMIPQEFNLVPTLRVYENVFLGQEICRRGGLLDHGAMRRESDRLLRSLKAELSPDAPISSLSVAEKQMVEIARVLVNDARVVILDEPTTVLTDREIDVLFDVVRQLQARGVAILFISHKLKEVKTLCQRLLILRDGEPVDLSPTSELSEDEMARRMVGRELSQVYPEKGKPTEQVALNLNGLTVPGVVDSVSLRVHRGEVVGLSGLVGAGRTEIAEAVMGLRKLSAGTIEIDGRPVTIKDPEAAHQHGLAYLSEDRQGRGLIMNFNLIENMTLLSLRRYTRGLIRHRETRARAEAFQQQFDIRAASLRIPVGLLSGGNQQKVYLAKLLDIEPHILILDEPTRGIDVGTKREIYRLIRRLADSGCAIVVISSELEEVIGLCDRVAVVRGGRIAAELSGDQLNEEDIMLYAAGVRDTASASMETPL